tara:strand:- start:754 stop:1737 length:984 start_codon:yes stop_codon:yes gene_type:complete
MNLSRNRKNEVKELVKSESNFDLKKISPVEVLNLVFGEYASNTQRAYARAFKNLQDWADIKNIDEMEDFDPLKILEFKKYLISLGKKPSTINQIMSALRKVCHVLNEFGFLKKNPFKSSLIRTEKVDITSNKGALKISQLNEMIEANQNIEYDGRLSDLLRYRNGIILKFLYLTAARRGEVADLNWDDIVQDGIFNVAILRNTKSGRDQRIKLRNELYKDLLDWRNILAENEIISDYVFPSLSFRTLGKKMSGKGINDIVVRLGKCIGLKISAHYLRHTAITLALEMGEPLEKVQSYARHASANTTIRYYHDRQLLEKNPTDKLPLI